MTEIIEVNNLSSFKKEFSPLLKEYFTWIFQNTEVEYPSIWLSYKEKEKITDLNTYANGYANYYLQEAEITKLQPPDGTFFFTKTDGIISGMGGLRKIDETTGEIKRMFVKPIFRGKKIGRLILENLVSKSNFIGYKKLKLDTIVFMKSAIGLYKSFGFKEISRYDGCEVPPEIEELGVYMELKLKNKFL
ncbi:MAG: GNAT family N-acetyltransferase [Candidatus Hodarchaeales archaeon]